MKKKIYGTNAFMITVRLKESKAIGEHAERFSFDFFMDSSADYTEIRQASIIMIKDVFQMNLKVNWVIISISVAGVNE